MTFTSGRNPSDYTTPSVIYGDDSSEETYGHEEILNNPLTEDEELVYMRAYQIKKQENEQVSQEITSKLEIYPFS